MQEILRFYSRKDVQKELVRLSKDREIAVKYSDKGFGKRPDILQYDSDVFELAKQGATSFHCSVERWKDPLSLKSGLTKQQLDDLRLSFDLFLDIDCKFLDYSKITAVMIIEALRFNGIKNISAKFSGNTGIHIGVPAESFPEIINGTTTVKLFPEAPRAIAEYLKNLLKKPLSEKILSISTLNEISETLGKPKKELVVNHEFDPYKLIEIDSQLISSRHMIRSNYSINEKSGLVSIPIKLNQIENFQLQQAKISNIEEVDHSFLDREKSEQDEAKQLFIQAFDYALKQKKPVEIQGPKDYEIPKVEIQEKFFPNCITTILSGLKEDGRKRSVFILVGFLQHMGWTYENILKTLLKWNKKNYEPLRDGYIIAQVNWFKRQPKKILPPNCDHESYYSTLGAKCFNCKYKNPVNFVKIKLKEVKNRTPKNRR